MAHRGTVVFLRTSHSMEWHTVPCRESIPSWSSENRAQFGIQPITDLIGRSPQHHCLVSPPLHKRSGQSHLPMENSSQPATLVSFWFRATEKPGRPCVTTEI